MILLDTNICILHGLSLRNGTRKSVKQKTLGTIGFLDALFHQIDNDLVGYQTARVHDLFCGYAERGAGFNSGTQHITG